MRTKAAFIRSVSKPLNRIVNVFVHIRHFRVGALRPPRGLQAVLEQGRTWDPGRNTHEALDRNFCRRWATFQEKDWEKMLRVKHFSPLFHTTVYRFYCI